MTTAPSRFIRLAMFCLWGAAGSVGPFSLQMAVAQQKPKLAELDPALDVNLGFSGNGRMDQAVGAHLVQVDAAAYLIDCLPNMQPAQVTGKCIPLIQQLRRVKPDTPILRAALAPTNN